MDNFRIPRLVESPKLPNYEYGVESVQEHQFYCRLQRSDTLEKALHGICIKYGRQISFREATTAISQGPLLIVVD